MANARNNNQQGKSRYATSTKERVEGELQERRQEEYGGLKIGAAFFGWLVAVGITIILTAIVSAIGVAIAFAQLDEVEGAEQVIGLIGGLLLLIITAVAYFAGGYVAGRLARFDGVRQGIGVWVIGVAVTILASIAGAIFGAAYNIPQQLEIPAIPVEAGELTAAGIVTLILILAATLVAAILGGKAGERYHKKIDRSGM